MKILVKKNKLSGKVINRETTIINLCVKKSVLHLGCADYPYHKERVANGTLLHEKLSKVSKRLFGIDNSPEGIAFLKGRGYDNLFLSDIEDMEEFKQDDKLDVIVAGEVLEHLSNVGEFFLSVHKVMSDETMLIVTTPNAHSIKNFIRVIMGKELIHPDHLYYFSPTNIEHICKRYGFKLIEYDYFMSESRNIMKKLIFTPIKFFIKSFSPYISDGILLIIKKEIKDA